MPFFKLRIHLVLSNVLDSTVSISVGLHYADLAKIPSIEFWKTASIFLSLRGNSGVKLPVYHKW